MRREIPYNVDLVRVAAIKVLVEPKEVLTHHRPLQPLHTTLTHILNIRPKNARTIKRSIYVEIVPAKNEEFERVFLLLLGEPQRHDSVKKAVLRRLEGNGGEAVVGFAGVEFADQVGVAERGRVGGCGG